MVRRVRLTVLLGLVAAVSAQVVAPAESSGGGGGGGDGGGEVGGSTRPPQTGNPQIDYKYDPNLPHELIGYDLSDYPFYNKLPRDLLDPKFNFTCDGRHDGFYASIPHKCQVYHNCLFGQRYDFLCANYTVFDQKNFICHYVSEVDCLNSEKHYDRNDELYETTTTTTTTQAPPQIIYVNRPRPLRGPGRIRPKTPRRPSFGGGGGGGGGGKRRPGKRRRTTTTTPAPDYYDYDYYDYYDEYYNDYGNEESTTTTTTTTVKPRRRPNRPRTGNRPRQGGAGARTGDVEDSGTGGAGPRGGTGERQGGGSNRPGGRGRLRSRNNPADAQEEPIDTRPSRSQAGGTREEVDGDAQDPQLDDSTGSRRRRPNRPRPKINVGRKQTTTTTTTEAAPDYFYDDYYDYPEGDQDTITTTTTTSTTTTAAPGRRTRPSSRTRPRGSSDVVEAEVTTEGSSATSGREGPRVSIRRTPIASDQRPTENEGAETVSVQRQRPVLPSRRGSATRNEPDATPEDVPLVEEEVGVEEVTEEQPISRRRGSSRVVTSSPGPAPPQQADPEYFYDY